MSKIISAVSKRNRDCIPVLKKDNFLVDISAEMRSSVMILGSYRPSFAKIAVSIIDIAKV
ncbi:hypothetical protein N7492_002738 [Penicillium capsulatum]|uniref:Uncharacterized protein n=1 Tax=Penicillium capsulatum TaxID=69766 RepID=A0A9W9LVH7_9EURO|nr:hypothetical protein N7492_002738 [Penicillium capsulatum]